MNLDGVIMKHNKPGTERPRYHSDQAVLLRERLIEILCNHFVIDGCAGLTDTYNARWHTISLRTVRDAVDELMEAIQHD